MITFGGALLGFGVDKLSGGSGWKGAAIGGAMAFGATYLPPINFGSGGGGAGNTISIIDPISAGTRAAMDMLRGTKPITTRANLSFPSINQGGLGAAQAHSIHPSYTVAVMLPEKVVGEQNLSSHSNKGDYLRYDAKFVNATRTQGRLIWFNDVGNIKGEWKAVSGSGVPKYYTIPMGNWYASYVNLEPHKKFTRQGISFRVTLGPDRYDPLRGRKTGLIRIHPANSGGTEGCIGLIENDAKKLLDFQHLIFNHIKKYKTIRVEVIYSK